MLGRYLSSYLRGGVVRAVHVGFCPSSKLNRGRDLGAGQSLWGMTSLDSSAKLKRTGGGD